MTEKFGHRTRRKAIDGLLANHESASIKRIAWAFGCARKDSDQEHELYKVLVERIEKLRTSREPVAMPIPGDGIPRGPT